MNNIRTNRLLKGLAYLLGGLSLIITVATTILAVYIASAGAFDRKPVASEALYNHTNLDNQILGREARDVLFTFYAAAIFIPAQKEAGRSVDTVWEQEMNQKLADLASRQDRPTSWTIVDETNASLWSNQSGLPILMSFTFRDQATQLELYLGAYGESGITLFETDVLDGTTYTIKTDLYQPYDPADEDQAYMYQAFYWLGQNRVALAILPFAGILTFLVCLGFLMRGAGITKSATGISLTWYDRLPVDLSLVLHLGLFIFLLTLLYQFFYGYRQDWIQTFNYLSLTFMIILAWGMTILGMRFLVSLAARFKAGWWWQCSLIWHPLHLISTILSHLPLLWKALLVMTGLFLLDIFQYDFFAARYNGDYISVWFLTRLVLAVAVCFLIIQLNRLKKAGQHLAAGDLDYKVDETNLVGDFRDHARNLNSIRQGIALAVDERLKSERFKTELITNVSHDIKTPLTSLISYVDLLKNLQIDDPTANEYIAVIDRQAKRLKKLSEDIVDASKAATGNLPVVLQQTDLIELLAQTKEEFTERLAASRLTLVSRLPAEPCPIMTDGRLLWRILDNLFQNVCKYAAPDSRVYLDLNAEAGGSTITLRNVSREPLSNSSDALLERFVQGDPSRAAEGSGLGLAIARSLTELIGGRFNLTLDGDLFKVTLWLPAGM